MFHSPLYLLLLLLLPWIAWRLFRSAPSAMRLSDVESVAKLPKTFRQRCWWMPPVLLLLTLAVLIVALARPRQGRRETISRSEGIAIELVVDRSGSMQAMDFRIDGRYVDRLTAIKNVAGKFVQGERSLMGRGALAGRPTDRVGLLSFAGYADAHCPPTLDHRFLVAQLDSLSIVVRRDEDGTAIGDAIALAVEKLSSLDATEQERIRSKVVILLTDGENNAGELEPIAAAELAETMGIKIYTIGVGTKGRAPFPVIDPFGRQQWQTMEVNIDEATLTKVAEKTGGSYFRATDTDSLQQIYERIDELEKTTIETTSFVDYREWATESLPTRWGTLPPLMVIAAALLLARLLVESVWLRTLTP